MLRLLGYTDRLSAGPGDTIRFMISCDHSEYESQLVRLIHGDTSPVGPGFRQEEVASSFDGLRAGKHESIHPGSYARVDIPGLDTGGTGSTFAVFVQPTNPGAGEQVIAGQGAPYAGVSGWALALDCQGNLELVVAQGGVPQHYQVRSALFRWHWYHVGITVGGGQATAWCQAVRQMPGEAAMSSCTVPLGLDAAPMRTPLLLAAIWDKNGAAVRHLDGRLDRPRLLARRVNAHGIAQLAEHPDTVIGDPDVVGAWELGLGVETDIVRDATRHGRHGRLINMPTRAVTGYNYTGRETDFRLAPEEYGAVHFHRDDLEDAGWGIDFGAVPPDLPSSVYAAWLRAGDDEDYLPFVVRPA